MLNCVIPMVMRVIHDHGGIIEKNTGDGVMAVFVSENDDAGTVAAALDAAATCFYVLRAFVNPHLESIGITAVNARIGIDFGTLLVSRIGLPTGAADHQRNFLTAVGATANIAFRLQEKAGTNEIWVGDNVWLLAASRQSKFRAATPDDWEWRYIGSGRTYWEWHYTDMREAPFSWEAIAALARLMPQPAPTGGPVRRRPILPILPPRT